LHTPTARGSYGGIRPRRVGQ